MSALGFTFVEVLKNEWLGIVASAFVLVSFLFSKQTVTRMINICGCIVFVVYGILLPAYSTAFMNAALIVVHVVFLVKDYLARKKTKAVNTADETPGFSDPFAETNSKLSEEPLQQAYGDEVEKQDK